MQASGGDAKWARLTELLADEPEMYEPRGGRRKLLVFAEHRDTLNYLARRLQGYLGGPEAVATIHGGMRRRQRIEAQETFTNYPE